MGAAGTQTVDTSSRLAKLRELMDEKDNSVKAFVVPSEDQREYPYDAWTIHLYLISISLDSSEYLAHCDERRAFISGFNGSAGDAQLDHTLAQSPHLLSLIKVAP